MTTTGTARHWVTWTAVLATLVGVWLLNYSDHRATESPKSWAARLSHAHHITIVLGPPAGESEAVRSDLTAQEPDRRTLPRALEGLERALDQYPVGFVSTLLRTVFIFGEVRINGVNVGGTVGRDWIVLDASTDLGDEGAFATSYIGLHHELSSIVMRRQPDTLAQWVSLEPAACLS